jgi:SAM-dependent methyltransferase
MAYEPKTYFNEMAKQMKIRPARRDVAGKNTPVYRHKRKAFLHMLRRLGVGGREVLEVGCGPGGNLEFLARRDPLRLAGCDISEEMIGLARERLNSSGLDMDLQVVDGRALPYADRSFDLVFTVTVLQHNSDDDVWCSLIAEICRITRHTVVLYEDVAPRDCGWATYRKRPVNQYVDQLKKNGFKLLDAHFLYLYWTERCTNRLHRIVYGTEPKEGATDGRFFSLFVSALLPILLCVDWFMRKKDGLVRMTFVRGGPSGEV